MAKIYEPTGAAREYSPLALNYFKGCDHDCIYCYVPGIMFRDENYNHANIHLPRAEEIIIKEITASARKHANSPQQVFLSFLTDPYPHFNKGKRITRRVLEILLQHKIPVSILTKGGYNVLEDLDLLKEYGRNIQIGASLTFTSENDSLKWEKNAAIPQERFETLKILHDAGIKTWASMEPVIFPDQSLEIMDITNKYVDGYKIGKLNKLDRHANKFNWTGFLNSAVDRMRCHDKIFYIKNDLFRFADANTVLKPQERDMDYMSLGKWQYKTCLFDELEKMESKMN
jgi:DNA repair photolyase